MNDESSLVLVNYKKLRYAPPIQPAMKSQPVIVILQSDFPLLITFKIIINSEVRIQ